ncbi:MAG: alpha-galactosidase [bacterium]
MPIIYNEQDKTISLHTRRTTYQMKVGPCGFLVHTYYGPSAEGDMSSCLVFRDRGFSGNPYDAGPDRTISADTLPLEYPCDGSGDYRATAFSLRRGSGAMGCDLRYVSHQIVPGKYALPGLPAVYADEAEAETLLVTLADAGAGVTVTLQYGVLPALDVITRAAYIENTGAEPITLQSAASAALDLPSGTWELMHFYGRHAGERTPARVELGQREVVIGSRRGTSSHQQSPFAILVEKGAGEDHGQCVGMSLVYSGSFALNASRDPFGTTRAVMGLQPEHFDYPLAPGESLQTPELILAYSGAGLAPLSHIFHRLISRHICRGPWRDCRRPVLLNNWEATGMDFDGEKLLSIAATAARQGVELMVLDDGWFGARNDDNAGLGDWVVNTAKLGCTMGELAEKIRAMGMKFGLWIEPEMVNENSDLYRAHPDWALQIPGKPPVRARNQLVLDFSRPEVVDAIFNQIAAVLDECRADYVKMDMNRSLSDIYSAASASQSMGKILYDYTRGVYRFMEMLLTRYPALLLEGCSGGGGRFDAGMLYYCPQIWCSDNTDAIDRIRIQFGTSYGFPLRTMGAHVSAVPNGDTRRLTPIETRAVVAMAGTFGYELDLNLLPPEELAQVPQQIERFQKDWNLLHNGLFYRLTDVTENRSEAAWMMVAEDGGEALVNVVTLDVTGNSPNRFIRCMGLTPGARYRDEETGAEYAANALMAQGFPLPTAWHPGATRRMAPNEYTSLQLHLKRI